MTTDEKAAAVEGRRLPILDAATRLFLRFGFKKASMDEIARAAGISRQALYFHFATKEVLFKNVVERMLAATRAAGSAALGRTNDDIEERLLNTFEAMHGHAIGQIGAEQMNELLDTATSLVGPVVQELEASFVADMAKLLARSGAAAAWKRAGISAKDLAETLYSTSCGLKHRVATLDAYRDGMRIAVRMACTGSAK